ncbi:MAG TPA: hypothetical protein PLY97_11860, partial [Acidocella sp.]|nr:hypothetical protein [Acidocella sp.]
ALNGLSGLIAVNALPQPNGSVIVTAGGTMLLDQSGAQNLQVNNGGAVPSLTAGKSTSPHFSR